MPERQFRNPAGAVPPVLEVRNPAGSVTLDAVEGADEVAVRVEALDPAAEELLDRVEITADDRDGSAVRVRVTVPKGGMFRTPSFAVHVSTPPDAQVRVAVASADVELRGRFGRADLTGASGDVVVDCCAELQLRSASGDARIGTVPGFATVGTASGDVRIGHAPGGLTARTASGEIAVEHAAGHVSLSTASGDVTVGATGEGKLKVKTVSGDATVGVVPGLRVWLDLSTVSGRMRSQLDGDGGGAGEGSPQLTLALRSVSGDLLVERAATTVAPTG
jgi:hypothetical protein